MKKIECWEVDGVIYKTAEEAQRAERTAKAYDFAKKYSGDYSFSYMAVGHFLVCHAKETLAFLKEHLEDHVE